VTNLLTGTLATLTIVILAYCFISAVNARSTFIYRQMAFEPHDYIAWLPHSYDGWATWQAFWMYLAFALSFWATRDWLLGKSGAERREARTGGRGLEENLPRRVSQAGLPMRLRRLLWLLCLNGSALALEAILQRLSGTNKLLWLLEPAINQSTESQFGPYAYRSNAAQYFNLLWPVCLGFWWTLRRATKFTSRVGRRLGSGPHVLLLPCAVLLAAAPIISTSRGGALVAITGYMLMFPFYSGLTVGNMELAEIFHAVVGVLFVALILGHIYLGTVGMEGAFGAMADGNVDLNWAKEHHSLWAKEEIQADKVKGGAMRPAE